MKKKSSRIQDPRVFAFVVFCLLTAMAACTRPFAVPAMEDDRAPAVAMSGSINDSALEQERLMNDITTQEIIFLGHLKKAFSKHRSRS